MYLWFRFALTVVQAFFRPKLRATDVSIVKMRVLPNDVDVTRMHNGRYPTFMDLGRIDLMIRQGYFLKLLRKRNYPLIGGQFIRYRKSLRLFQQYEVHSQFVYWNEKWGYLSHRFVVDGELYAVGYVRGLFRGPQGNVPIEQMFSLGNGVEKCPPQPEWINEFDAVFMASELS